ncbi:MAG: hypothetical protein APR54_11005 [Candidatus Cloacimonas sp. SDB]|nr:MAG: hypothetical protein APR54_11005 [Candidatus Cloacimonas sp. SDB]
MFKVERTLKSSTGSGLKVKFKSKNIGIRIKGWETEESELKLEMEYSSASGREYDLGDYLILNYDDKLNEMQIEFKELADMKIVFADLKLSVPEKSEINADTENGSLSMQNLNGIFELKTENGSVTASEITGGVTIKTENGSLRLKECSCECNLKNENGAIKIKECNGDLKIVNENGQVRILGAGYDSAEIINENGGIYYEFCSLEEGKFTFKNENGKIDLIVPDDLNYDLTARNEIGNINISVAGNYDKSRENDMNIVHLVHKSGKVKIDASNENGSINISGDKIRKSRNFEFFNFSDIFNDVMDNIPEIDKAKLKIKLDKAKDKIEKINFKDVESKINTTLKKVENAIEKEFGSEKSNEILKKVKTGFKAALKDFEKFSTKDMGNGSNEVETAEKSKLKILQMLQNGKINSEEAEKLLKALGDKNGR